MVGEDDDAIFPGADVLVSSDIVGEYRRGVCLAASSSEVLVEFAGGEEARGAGECICRQ